MQYSRNKATTQTKSLKKCLNKKSLLVYYMNKRVVYIVKHQHTSLPKLKYALECGLFCILFFSSIYALDCISKLSIKVISLGWLTR